jgi:multicomponent Na+:H+ antiporter subunit A
VFVAGVVVVGTFFGKKIETPKHSHEAPTSMWLGPVVLAGLSLLIGIFPELVSAILVAPAVSATMDKETAVKLALWHDINPVFLLSIATILAGIGLYAVRVPVRRLLARLTLRGAEKTYALALDGLNALARGQTRILQSGYLRFYLMTIVLTTVGVTGAALLSRYGLNWLNGLNWNVLWEDVRIYELGLAVLVLLAAMVAALSSSRLGAVAALGVVGYGVALFFLLFGAPDLAMTQFTIESLTVILFVLVFYHLPRLTRSSPRSRHCVAGRWVDDDACPFGKWRPVAAEHCELFCRECLAVGAWAQHRQCHLGGFSRAGYAGRNYRAGYCRHRRVCVAQVAKGKRRMTSLILRTAARYLLPLLLLFSLFVFGRGHNEPGGGFVGGLIAAAAFVLYTIAYDAGAARRALSVEPRGLIGLGLLIALGSGLISLLNGQPFMTGQWGKLDLPGFGKVEISTPLLFDLGVYLAVLGVTLVIIFALAEE